MVKPFNYEERYTEPEITLDHNGMPLYDFREPMSLVVNPLIGEISLTRQEFKDECDVNKIMEHYEKTAVMPPSRWNGPPEFFDVSNIPDLAGAMAVLQKAEVAFMTLPPQVRLTFENDPVQFVAFAEDRANVDQMRAWGLAPPAPVVLGDDASSVGGASGGAPAGDRPSEPGTGS